MNRTGIYAARPGVRLHANLRTDVYLRSLRAGARVVDPGDLDLDTELELERLTQNGTLVCKRNHGRRIWRRKDDSA